MPKEERRTQDELMREEKAHHNELVWRSMYRQSAGPSIVMGDRLLLRHVLILGSTGSGKTNHVFHILQEVLGNPVRSVTAIILDVKREYRALAGLVGKQVQVLAIGDEPMLRFNPVIPPLGVEADLWDRAFADAFTRAYGLSEPSRRIMLDCLFKLREGHKESPTIRELEREVGMFEAGSPKELNSKRSLESRLHLINTGPVGASLNDSRPLDIGKMDERLMVFEIGRIDSLRDQRFVAETVLLLFWYHDKFHEVEGRERLKRLIVVEEAHRYLSEERPSAQRGDRTLLELAIAEARRYGWGFLIVDQMPLLLSRYVWDNMGTIFCHRLSNLESLGATVDALGGAALKQVCPTSDFEIVCLTLPEDLSLFRSYLEDPKTGAPSVGVTHVKNVTESSGRTV